MTKRETTMTTPKTHAHVHAVDADDDPIACLHSLRVDLDQQIEANLDEGKELRASLARIRADCGRPDPETLRDHKGDDRNLHRTTARAQELMGAGGGRISTALREIERNGREALQLASKRAHVVALISDGPGTAAKHAELAALTAVSFEAFLASMLPVLGNVTAARAAFVEAVETATAMLAQRMADAERAKVVASAVHVEAPEVRCLPLAAALAMMPSCPSTVVPWVTTPSVGPRRRVAEAMLVGSWFGVTSATVVDAIAAYAPSDDAFVASVIADPGAFDRHCREAVGRAESELRRRREATQENVDEGPPYAA